LTASNQKFVFNLHLCNSKNAEIIWSQRIVATADDLTEESAQLIGDVAQSIHDALTQNLIEPALSKPLPSISSYGLFLAGTNMLHRHCRPDFYRSLSCFDGLVDRHSRHALAYAWRARWRLMAVVNGFSQNSNQDIDLALQDAKAALKFDASHPVSLAVYGQVNNQFLGHEENAVDAFDQALQRDQSECMAWLFKSIHSSMWGDTKLAISQAQQAHELSRLDPHQYYYQMALANAYLSDNQHTKAIEHAENSLRLNASHPATHRILITALYELDRGDQAKEQLNKLLKIQPHLNLKRMASLGSHESRTRKRSLAALQALGIPEH
jgi:tetratricopeptide (TPR) repeat protein